ncbi:helix-turn-helix domain-containing protein [Nocardia nova]
MDLAGNYSKQTHLLERLVLTSQRAEDNSRPALNAAAAPPTAGRKKHVTAAERAEIVAKYKAGASLVQLRTEHRMAKRTVTKLLREAGVTIRPRGGQQR